MYSSLFFRIAFIFSLLSPEPIEKMKVAITFALVGCASAFVPSSPSPKTLSLKESTDAAAVPKEPLVPVAAEPVLPKMSQSLPFVVRPSALKGELAGDVGFDPVGAPLIFLNYCTCLGIASDVIYS